VGELCKPTLQTSNSKIELVCFCRSSITILFSRETTSLVNRILYHFVSVFNLVDGVCRCSRSSHVVSLNRFDRFAGSAEASAGVAILLRSSDRIKIGICPLGSSSSSSSFVASVTREVLLSYRNSYPIAAYAAAERDLHRPLP